MTIQERVECMEKLAAGEWDGNAFHQPADKVETVVTPVEPEMMTPEAIAEMARERANMIANLRAKLRQEQAANKETVKKETKREQSIRRSADNLQDTKAWLDRISLVPATAGLMWGGKQLFGKGMPRNERFKGGGKVLLGAAGTGLAMGGSALIGNRAEKLRQEADEIIDANQQRLAQSEEKARQDENWEKEQNKSKNTERAFMRMPVVKGEQPKPATSGSTAKPSWKGFANKKK